MANGNCNGDRLRSWLVLILWIVGVVFAAGGGWALLSEQAKCNARQDGQIEQLHTEDKRLEGGNQKTREDVIEIKADLKYIRQAIDEMRRP